MKKLILAFFIIFFTTPLALSMQKSDQEYDLQLLEEYFSKIDMRPYLALKIKDLPTVCQQDMTNALIIALNKGKPNIAYQLIMLWKDKIDINLTRTAKKPRHTASMGATVLGELLCFYTYIHIHSLDCLVSDTAPYHKIYLKIYELFKDTINVNIAERESNNEKPKTFIGIMLSHSTYYDIQCRCPATAELLDDFLKRFHYRISKEVSDDAFKLCNIYEDDSEHCKSNKTLFLNILQSYFPKKSNFTKKGLNKTHNCYFLYVKNLE